MSQEQNKTISGNIHDVYTEDSQDFKHNRMPRVGQTVEFEDGRKLVFCSTLADLTPGMGVGRTSSLETTVSGAVLVGAYKVNVLAAGVVANLYSGGHIIIAGIPYKIKGNKGSATVGGVADVMVVELYDRVGVGIADGGDVSIRISRDQVMEVLTTGQEPVGFAVVGAQGTTLSKVHYLWIQYEGPGAVRTAATTIGGALMGSTLGVLIACDGSLPAIATQTGAPVGGVAMATITCPGQ